MNDIQKDVDKLVENPDITMGAKYHDSGSCWQLIEEMRSRLIMEKEKEQSVIRDQFAMAVLGNQFIITGPEKIAEMAYKIADAMMKERNLLNSRDFASKVGKRSDK